MFKIVKVTTTEFPDAEIDVEKISNDSFSDFECHRYSILLENWEQVLKNSLQEEEDGEEQEEEK